MIMDQGTRRQHFVVLDGLRGVAAIIVVFLHSHQAFIDTNPFLHAHLAVDFFFCLSGFVIAHAYGGRLAGGMGFGEFLAARLIRLYPMIAVGTLLGGLVYALGDHGSEVTILLSAATFFLLPAGLTIGYQAYPTNNPIWSLFFELGANVLYALAPPISARAFGAFAIFSTAALIVTSLACGGVGDLGFDDGTRFVLGFVRVTCPFVLGVGIYRLGLDKRLEGRPAWITVALLITVLLVPSPLGGWYDSLAVVLAFPLVVTLATRSRLRHGAWCLAQLGRVSYPLYLVHQPLLRMLRHVALYQRFVTHSPVLALMTAVAIALAFSFAVVVLFDEPVRRFLTRMSRARDDRSSSRLALFEAPSGR